MEVRALFEANQGLVHMVAKRFATVESYEDTFQVCCVGFVKAARAFRSEMGFKFSTFAFRVMSNECRKEFRTRQKWRAVQLEVDPCYESDPLFDTVDELEHALSVLKPRERYVLEQRARGRTLKDIGKDLGVGLNRTSQIEQAALKKAASHVVSGPV